MKRQHRHADMMCRWLDDDSLVLERFIGALNGWQEDRDPPWSEDDEYRFKPKMIKCGDLEFPEPMRVAPEYGSDYYVVAILQSRKVCNEIWRDIQIDHTWLKRGLCHETEAAAEAHARALIALTEVK